MKFFILQKKFAPTFGGFVVATSLIPLAYTWAIKRKATRHVKPAFNRKFARVKYEDGTDVANYTLVQIIKTANSMLIRKIDVPNFALPCRG